MISGILGVIDAYNNQVRVDNPGLYEYERGHYIHVHISNVPPMYPVSRLTEQLKGGNYNEKEPAVYRKGK